jgi:hypothetical protein
MPQRFARLQDAIAEVMRVDDAGQPQVAALGCALAGRLEAQGGEVEALE